VSSLLDVLHGRSSRASRPDVTHAETEPAAGERQSAELLLAPELELAAGAAEHPNPSEPTEGSGVVALLEEGRPPTAHAAAAPAIPDRSSHTSNRHAEAGRTQPAADLGRPRGRRSPLLWVLAAAGSLFAAFLVYEFAGQEEQSFLVDPSAIASAPETTVELAVPPLESPPAPPASTPAFEPRPSVAIAEPIAEPVAAPVELGRSSAPQDTRALPVSAAASTEPEPSIQISRGRSDDPLFKKLRGAYAALVAGDNGNAESLYREVLARDAGNIDALLGLASLAARGGRQAEARDLFRQVERLDPRNSTAAAALALLPGASPQASGESQLKILLREQPTSAALYFALGLHYVAEQRWPDAQATFFEAVRHEPTNADYAFNLAVSLDRLGHVQPAANYYQRALDLVSGSQRFDVTVARARLAALRAPQG
jgi:Tfp pilus assembly protein PilF